MTRLTKLTQVFFFIFVLIVFFSISSFNIGLIEKWTSYFVLIYFLLGYPCLMIHVWQVNPNWLNSFFSWILFIFHSSTLGLIIFFYFLFVRLLGSYNLNNKFNRLTRVDLNRFNMLSFQYFKKDIILVFFLN